MFDASMLLGFTLRPF